jgi:hypothetical protein
MQQSKVRKNDAITLYCLMFSRHSRTHNACTHTCQCPECGATIGGQSHRLLTDNRALRSLHDITTAPNVGVAPVTLPSMVDSPTVVEGPQLLRTGFPVAATAAPPPPLARQPRPEAAAVSPSTAPPTTSAAALIARQNQEYDAGLAADLARRQAATATSARTAATTSSRCSACESAGLPSSHVRGSEACPRLPEQPPDGPDALTLRVRLPSGIVTRRFLRSDPGETLLVVGGGVS